MRDVKDLVGDEGLPNPYDDAGILRRYREAGGDLSEVIYLSLGETWCRAAPGLRNALAASLPPHCHGYSLSPYGFPALHSVLRTYITDTHQLETVAELGTDYEVAVSQCSTRNAMFHFGRLLVEESQEANAGKRIVIASTPGWDYTGVYTALGFEMRYFNVTSHTSYQPDHEEIHGLLRKARGDTDGPVLLVVNAQHNPTGANWYPSTVRAMIRSAVATGACILVDDAYYAVHNPDTTPTNTLRILLEELNPLPLEHRPRWLAVRSLGKQFHCNGWGIGALTAGSETVERLVTHLLPQYTYVSAIPLQAAMAAWLCDVSSETYLARQRAEYAAKRLHVTRRLTHDLGYPQSAFFPGECAAYLLMRIPPWCARGPHGEPRDFRVHCLARTGVLLGEAHMTTPGRLPNDSRGYVRLYLGTAPEVLDEALVRIREAGLTWNQPSVAGLSAAKTMEE
ncbi:pyridoxal phosphate-dependent aminotransferase [Streptomyces sp. KN37]|uniref:pyridoxal phosphate-dependent aminotransferase n=1 Tax=Streptomyces sp. KN37 TaxID=3090667 RepID=UPI002A74BDD0|nr:pyridoxal phosphate-dependent aminotransferase [Streptomyces sp. KN37]WPO70456.1 pyridoxal phosphate-dependent aminotransferase [Streptomyces sp. KN37]